MGPALGRGRRRGGRRPPNRARDARRREYLRYPPDRAYLFKAVRTQTLKLKVSGYRRFIVTMPWDSLRAVEEINEQARHGKVLP